MHRTGNSPDHHTHKNNAARKQTKNWYCFQNNFQINSLCQLEQMMLVVKCLKPPAHNFWIDFRLPVQYHQIVIYCVVSQIYECLGPVKKNIRGDLVNMLLEFFYNANYSSIHEALSQSQKPRWQMFYLFFFFWKKEKYKVHVVTWK